GALKMYTVDMKIFPDTEDGLGALLKAPDDERRAKMWDGPYLDEDKLPLDPWGNEYQYEFDAANGDSKPRIFSPGPDGETDTDDDIANRGKSGEGDDSSDVEDDSENDSSEFD
ncbi:MAG: type II secretion system protein GspG, partial [Planctomycetota bacterium]|nr:type II secretion system protein GspG [Planctomycetota bacterium]